MAVDSGSSSCIMNRILKFGCEAGQHQQQLASFVYINVCHCLPYPFLQGVLVQIEPQKSCNYPTPESNWLLHIRFLENNLWSKLHSRDAEYVQVPTRRAAWPRSKVKQTRSEVFTSDRFATVNAPTDLRPDLRVLGLTCIWRMRLHSGTVKTLTGDRDQAPTADICGRATVLLALQRLG